MEKTIKIPSATLLFGKGEGPKNYEAADGFVDFGASMTVIPAIQCPGRQKHQSSARARIGRAALVNADCKVSTYGDITVVETDAGKYATDGKTVWTTEADGKHQRLVDALVHWYAKQNRIIRDYIAAKKERRSTRYGAFIASDEFYYSYLIENEVSEVTVVYGCDEEDPVFSKSQSIPSASKGFPWSELDLPTVFDAPVEYCKKGLFRLNWKAGEVSLPTGQTYDMSRHVIDTGWFDRTEYIDNPAFALTLSRIVMCVEAMYRVSGKTYDPAIPINEALSDVDGVDFRSNLRNILLFGTPGTGKSTLFEAIGAATGIPVGWIRTDEFTESDKFTVVTEVTETSANGFKSVVQPYLVFLMNGGLFFVDDAANCRPSVLFANLGGPTDAAGVLPVGDWVIQRHPMSFIGITTNIGTETAQEFDSALINRFSEPIEVEALPKERFLTAIAVQGTARSGVRLDALKIVALAEWIYDTMESARQLCTQCNADAAANLFSLRNAITLCESVLNALSFFGKTGVVEKAIRAYSKPLGVAGDQTTAKLIEDAIKSTSVQKLVNAGIPV